MTASETPSRSRPRRVFRQGAFDEGHGGMDAVLDDTPGSLINLRQD
jgi:hypothetical protein